MRKDIYHEVNIEPKVIPHNSKVYAIINTIEYGTKDYSFGVIVTSFPNYGKFFDFGFEEDDLLRIGKLEIGDICYFAGFSKSLSVVRLA